MRPELRRFLITTHHVALKKAACQNTFCPRIKCTLNFFFIPLTTSSRIPTANIHYFSGLVHKHLYILTLYSLSSLFRCCVNCLTTLNSPKNSAAMTLSVV